MMKCEPGLSARGSDDMDRWLPGFLVVRTVANDRDETLFGYCGDFFRVYLRRDRVIVRNS